MRRRLIIPSRSPVQFWIARSTWRRAAAVGFGAGGAGGFGPAALVSGRLAAEES